MAPTLLFVSYAFPPENTSGGIRTWRTVERLAAEYDIVVLTRSHGESSGLVDELPDNVTVYRSYEQDVVTRLTYKPLWVATALRKAREIFATHDIDLLWTRYTPIAPHLVGLALKRRYDVPWIGYFGDPWVDSPYKEGSWVTSRTVERAVVRNADALTFSTERLSAMFAEQYPGIESNCHVVPNFVDPEEIERVAPTQRADDGVVRFTHIGNLYGLRTPKPLLEALTMLPASYRERTAVEFIGETVAFDDLFAEYGDLSAVTRIDRLPKDEAIARAKAADVLLLLDAPVTPSPFLPMKLVEYLFMERPILGLTPTEGTSADVLRDTNAGEIAPPDDPAAIAATIEGFHDRREPRAIDDEARRRYSAEAAVDELSRVIADLL